MVINDKEIYSEAKQYLLRFDGITDKILNKQTTHNSGNKPKNKNELFKAMLEHATNRRGMGNYIGNIGSLANVLYSFEAKKVISNYKNWTDIFDAIKMDVITPGKMDKTNNRNTWVVFSKIILSMAEYVERYKKIDDFYNYVEEFNTYNTRLGLPLILSNEVMGFGFALACDFLKERISPLFIKPDIHIRDIFIGIGKSKKDANDFQIFRDVIQFSENVEAYPYEVDKVFWLIGSGKFYSYGITIKSKKTEFIELIRRRNLAIA